MSDTTKAPEEHEWVFLHKHSTIPVCRKCNRWETPYTLSMKCNDLRDKNDDTAKLLSAVL